MKTESTLESCGKKVCTSFDTFDDQYPLYQENLFISLELIGGYNNRMILLSSTEEVKITKSYSK